MSLKGRLAAYKHFSLSNLKFFFTGKICFLAAVFVFINKLENELHQMAYLIERVSHSIKKSHSTSGLFPFCSVRMQMDSISFGLVAYLMHHCLSTFLWGIFPWVRQKNISCHQSLFSLLNKLAAIYLENMVGIK